MASLDNARSKINWAATQFEFLKGEIVKHIQKDPGKFAPKRYSPAKDEVWGRFVAGASVPLPISLLFGDVLLSIQSSLDYLIWELVEFSGIEKPSTSNQFPIVESRNLFEEEIGRKRLRGVPFQAVALIEGMQPYHSAKGLHDSPLFALKTLANIYKHRYLPLSALAARLAPPDLETFVIDGATYARATQIFDQPFDPDEEFGPFGVVGNQIDLKASYAMVIVLRDAPYRGREVTSLLGWICTTAADIVIPQFEQFF